MIRSSFLIACLILFCSLQTPSPSDWQGLAPLKSTRLDVERTLGPPDQNIDNENLTYGFPDKVVYFFFTSNPNCQQQLPYTSWNVTSHTLTGIDVILRPQPRIADTDIDLTKLKKVKGDFDLVDRYVYLNADNSFGIEVGNDYLAGYHYQPGSKHEKLRCEATRKAP